MAEVQKITIAYWPFQGLSQVPKYIMEYLNIPYTQKFYLTPEDWGKDKAANVVEFPNLPYIIDGDFKTSETLAINTYLPVRGKRPDLLGKTDQDRTRVFQLYGVLNDFGSTIGKICFAADKDTAEKALAETTEKTYKPKLVLIDKALEGKEFLMGYITIADFFLYFIINFLNLLDKNIVAGFANLTKFFENFESQQWLKDYKASNRYNPNFLSPKATLLAADEKSLGEFLSKVN